MKAAELADELADFWFSAIAGASWEDRLKILQEIDSQLRADLETRSDYEAVWPRFVAAIIDRLGTASVTSEAQAKIYASSASEYHRAAGSAWNPAGATRRQSSSGPPGDDRRRFPRQRIDAISEIWVRGQSISCRLIDLSLGGVRVVAEGADPAPGTSVRVVVPNSGVRDAKVVFRNELGIGLEFSDQPVAA